MACFLTPLVVAVVLSLLRLVRRGSSTDGLGLLNLLMWGGAVALTADHVINGEIVAYPPFLTALEIAGPAVVLEEILIVGGGVTLSVFTLWGAMVTVPKLVSVGFFEKIRRLRAR